MSQIENFEPSRDAGASPLGNIHAELNSIGANDRSLALDPMRGGDTGSKNLPSAKGLLNELSELSKALKANSGKDPGNNSDARPVTSANGHGDNQANPIKPPNVSGLEGENLPIKPPDVSDIYGGREPGRPASIDVSPPPGPDLRKPDIDQDQEDSLKLPGGEDLVNPDGHVEPEGPVNPDGRLEPEGPVNPDGRLEPEGPVNPDGRLEPEGPVNPANPDGRLEPAGPFDPESPNNPDKREKQRRDERKRLRIIEEAKVRLL